MRINFYTIKQVKEKGINYNIESIHSPESVYKILRDVLELDQEAQEKFGVLALNTKNKVVGIHIISTGSLNASIVHPREVFKSLMLNNACSFVAFHNHPSGDSTPSREDIEITKRLAEAGEIMGIDLLDHIIIGDHYTSLKQMGVI